MLLKGTGIAHMESDQDFLIFYIDVLNKTCPLKHFISEVWWKKLFRGKQNQHAVIKGLQGGVSHDGINSGPQVSPG